MSNKYLLRLQGMCIIGIPIILLLSYLSFTDNAIILPFGLLVMFQIFIIMLLMFIIEFIQFKGE
jgi:hypothetical protein